MRDDVTRVNSQRPALFRLHADDDIFGDVLARREEGGELAGFVLLREMLGQRSDQRGIPLLSPGAGWAVSR